VNENSVRKWALPDVAKDVAALEQVLIHPERCAYPPGNVKVITGEEASRGNILDQLEWLEERIKADASGNATAVVYYTGHGWRDTSAEPDEFYFIPYDVCEDKIRSRALRAGDFVDAVEALGPQRLLVVLDCCHAGGMGVKDVMPLPTGYAQSAFKPAELMARGEVVAEPGAKGLEQLAEGRGRAVFSSSTGEQSSYMRPDGEMSIFTYHLIEALTGHAQPQEGATDVLVSDVMSYVHRHVPKSADEAWGRDQNPDLKTSGIFPIALLLGGGGWSKGQKAPDPLAKLPESEEGGVTQRVDTGGGAYIGGGVRVNGGDFVGRDQVIHGDQYRARDISGQQVAFGREAQVEVTTGLSGEEIDRLFKPLMDAVGRATPDKQVEAKEMAEALKREVQKADMADDTTMAKLINGLVELVPGAMSTVTSMFATPIMGGLAGNATKFVLDMIQRK
jgi:hypothetical protein